jgi:hypothetical protein
MQKEITAYFGFELERVGTSKNWAKVKRHLKITQVGRHLSNSLTK